jgi:ADP-heptose:LPS heptosyltransferase
MPPTLPTDPRRPLIVRIRNWVGDVILGIPALLLLERQGYDLHIVARAKWAPSLMAGHGWPVHVQPASLGEKVKQLRTLRRQLRAIDPGFDRRENAIVLPQSLSSALEMRLAGLKAVGYGQEGRSPLLARSERITYGGHALIAYWTLALKFLRRDEPPPAQVGWRITAAKQAEADALLEGHGLQPGYLMICPFAGGVATSRKLNKKWPAFPDFLRQARRELGLPIVVYPGPGEDAEARERYPDALLLQGADLGVYGGLLRRAALVVANDTGPAHMAAALDARLLSVLGPTFPEQWSPWGPGVQVIRKPQPPEGTAWPAVDEVMEQVRRLLGESRGVLA